MTQPRRPTSADTQQARQLRAEISKPKSLRFINDEVLEDVESRKRNFWKIKMRKKTNFETGFKRTNRKNARVTDLQMAPAI